MPNPYVLRQARKQHACKLCDQPIGKGEHYYYARLGPMHHPENEHFFDYKAHEECHRFWWDVVDPDDGLFPEEPWDFRASMQAAQMQEFGFVEVA